MTKLNDTDNQSIRYIIKGTNCDLNSNSTLITDDCKSVHYEIQDLSYDPLNSLGIGSHYQNIDFAQSSLFWGVAFTSVVFFWLFSHGIGHILKLVKNA